MGMGVRGGVAREFQSLLDAGAIGSLDDGELLARFLRGDGSAELAFAALVDRHARMVLRVCRDVLGDPHEAQDAAQATFFILARRAATIRKAEALPSWLHGTARRVASRSLKATIRRRRLERRSVEGKPYDEAPAEESRRGWPELHEELSRLPDRYREAIVLCDLAGMTHEQAAGKLGCPARTLETRLYRGRERLKGRLIRRGVAPSAALVGTSLATGTTAAAPPSWVAATAATATALASRAGWVAAAASSARAPSMARTHLKELVMVKVKLILASGLLLGLAWRQLPADPPPAPSVGGPRDVPSPRPEPVAKAKAAIPEAGDPKVYTHPITLSGRALDPGGKPLPGARVYLASLRADYKRLAETITDAEGRYEFRAVPLPIERSDTATGEDHGRFQVFGQAEGFGFAWRPAKWFCPKPQPSNISYMSIQLDPPARYRPADAIHLDLNFPAAAHLVGAVVDDRGKPLQGVRLEIRGCEPLKEVDKYVIGGWTFDSLNERDSAPASMKLRATDAQGRFAFQGMPADCRFRIDIKAEGFPSRWISAATTGFPQPDHDGAPVLAGDMTVTLPTAMDVPIQMLFADTSKPAAHVAVQAGGGDVSDFESSDDQGRAILRFPKGKYRMENWPARGTPYLVTESELVVGDEPPRQPIIRTLRPAAILEVTVVDEATGEGLEDVDLWHMAEGRRQVFVMRSWEAMTRIARRDSPRSDAQGKLRAFIEPGAHRFGVGREAYPRGYVAAEDEGQEVLCRAGETSSLKFTMRKRRRD